MKKKKFLATILIASSAFLGTGYAWWSDGLEIKGVVSTGEFKIVGDEGEIKTKGKYGNDIITKMNKNTETGIEGFSYVINDLYPYQYYNFTAKFKNQGSIPAQVADIEISKSVESDYLNKEDIFDHLQVTGTVKVIDQEGNQVSEEGNESTKEYKYSIEGRNVTVNNMEDNLRNHIIGWNMEPSQSIIFEDFKIKLVNVKYDKKDKRNLCEGSRVQFDLKVSFNQHNQQ
ncbi:MAG: hypothetical protein K0S30_99 [Clostridia bacterium]|nr:hypothetical protein [Clostridia bacterium]